MQRKSHSNKCINVCFVRHHCEKNEIRAKSIIEVSDRGDIISFTQNKLRTLNSDLIRKTRVFELLLLLLAYDGLPPQMCLKAFFFCHL